MKFILLKFLSKCLFFSQLYRISRYLHKKKVIILAYHGFTNKKNYKGIKNGQGLHINADKFKSQIEYLKKHYNIISLEQLTKFYTDGIKLPNNSVVITIDDGYKSTHTLAYPILKQFNVPTTIFPSTNFIDKKEALWIDRIEYAIYITKSENLKLRIGKEILSFDFPNPDSKKTCYKAIYPKLKLIPQESRDEIIENLEFSLGQKLSITSEKADIYHSLEWHEIREMTMNRLISAGSHSCSHLILTRSTPENMEKEVSLSKQLIENQTKMTCSSFCYPNGESGDFNHETKELLKKSGYSCGLTSVWGKNNKYSDIFELKRYLISSKYDLIIFIMILSGALNFIKNIKKLNIKFLKAKK